MRINYTRTQFIIVSRDHALYQREVGVPMHFAGGYSRSLVNEMTVSDFECR